MTRTASGRYWPALAVGKVKPRCDGGVPEPFRLLLLVLNSYPDGRNSRHLDELDIGVSLIQCARADVL
jgi:hypothetical protein